MIRRPRHLGAVERLLERYPVVAILGARQVGKTTLARQVSRRRGGPVRWYDLEDPMDLGRLDPTALELRQSSGLVVLDEIHRRPELFPTLRVLADRRPLRTRFLVLGSASIDLMRQSSETLAGRIAYYTLPGLALDEVGSERLERLWLRGGFPLSFLAPDEAASTDWRRRMLTTFLERDIPQLGLRLPAATLRRFWTMVAHYHGQIWNASEIGGALGVADTTVRGYLDALTSTFVVRTLAPWRENLKKRQVRSPKTYVTDSGLLHRLLGLNSKDDLLSHPKAGASWEGFGIETVIQRTGAHADECHFWATHAGAELDLLIVRGRHRRGFEFKRSAAPPMTPSMHIAMRDLRLDSIDVVHAGSATYPMAPQVRALPLARVFTDLAPLK